MFSFIILMFWPLLRGIGGQEMGNDGSQTHTSCTAQYVVARALTASTELLSVFKWIQDFVLTKENFKTVAYFNDKECIFN